MLRRFAVLCFRLLNLILGKFGLQLARQSALGQYVSTLATLREEQLIAAAMRVSGSKVVIGAYDLVSFDTIGNSLSHSRDAVYLFEPRKGPFQKLQAEVQRLGLENIYPINRAVHPSKDEIDIFEVHSLHEQAYPEWAKGVASADEAHVLKFVRKEHIGCERVRCSRPEQWPIDFGIERIAYLQIDTEGMDFEILKAINLIQFDPAVIKIEVSHLDRVTRGAVARYLREFNFDMMVNGEDLIAFKLNRII